MPNFDSKKVKEALFELIKLEKDWIPTEPGTALYIRTNQAIKLGRNLFDLQSRRPSKTRHSCPYILLRFELIKLEKDWIPTEPGTALYIRPTLIANQEMLGEYCRQAQA